MWNGFLLGKKAPIRRKVATTNLNHLRIPSKIVPKDLDPQNHRKLAKKTSANQTSMVPETWRHRKDPAVSEADGGILAESAFKSQSGVINTPCFFVFVKSPLNKKLYSDPPPLFVGFPTCCLFFCIFFFQFDQIYGKGPRDICTRFPSKILERLVFWKEYVLFCHHQVGELINVGVLFLES